MRYIFLLVCLKFFWCSCDEASHAFKMKQDKEGNLQWDERGYLFFCLCMGRFGNQVDHFLGSLAFAKDIDRTLVIPSWRTYKNIRFTEWFKLEPIQEYHRAVLAEDFMEYLAPQHWPPGNRTGFCFSYTQDPCEMKKGNPFGPYWDELGVDFDNTVNYNVGYSDVTRWKKEFPPEKYPVLALKGAPAAFPVKEENRDLQRYLQWSDTIKDEAEKYINQNFPNQTFVGIHLRNGQDWENACQHVESSTSFMASPQCLGFNNKEPVTAKLCLPPKEEILRLTQKVVLQTGAKVVYVATDKYSMVKELEDDLKPQKVKIYHQDPWLPQIDLYILGQADHFIGNCVSSFTSFVTRERHVHGKPTSFWGFKKEGNLQWDERGYLFFCLCMGRFGNQVDHFLGSLAFAKDIDRTLVIPSWRTYKNIRFTEWFKLEPIQEYHRAVLAEDFMEYLAPQHWPPGNRTGFCFSYTQDPCEMKKGNPFGPYWDELGVDFDNTVNYNVGYSDVTRWKKEFPPEKYPVLALKGAPAAFPVKEENRDLQRYLQWSDTIKDEAEKYINQNFPNQTFVGIHLRNGQDWENACQHVESSTSFMASPQCLGFNNKEPVTAKLCLPPKEEILRLTQKVVLQTGAKVVYVATDKYSMVKELEDDLKPQKVKVYHQDPWLPQIDLYILGQADHFIGNCVSSFTSFVTRERHVHGKPTSFWGFS